MFYMLLYMSHEVIDSLLKTRIKNNNLWICYNMVETKLFFILCELSFTEVKLYG